jgi:hypothetical protein
MGRVRKNDNEQEVDYLMMSGYVHDVEGVEQDTVTISVTLGRAGFKKLIEGSVPCSEVWLTKQPDGTFALGVVTPVHPEALGFQARAVENDDRKERFPS